MKFDIVKYIDDLCEGYWRGYHTKAYTLSAIKLALDDDSWQNLCDGKEAVDNVIEADGQTWSAHLDWCIEDEAEEPK